MDVEELYHRKRVKKNLINETIEEKVYTQNRIRIELFWLRVYWYEKRIRMSNWFEPNRSQRSQE